MVFLKYSTSAALGLLYFSLIGGFSAPKIVKVLDSTSYLTQDIARTWQRLNETFEMVIDCLESEDSLKVGEKGWKAVIKVRLLHSKVRLKILSGNWSASEYGLPINQEDMMATLLAFSINVLDSIKKIGAPLSREV